MNEVLSLSLHFIILLMVFDDVNEVNDKVKNAAIYNVLAIWVINSVFTVTKFVLKIVEFFRSRVDKNKVEPETKKDIMISNLDT